MPTPVNGSLMRIFYKTASGTRKIIALATADALNIERNEIDGASKDTGDFGFTIPGRISWNVNTNFLVDPFDNALGDLYQVLRNGTEVEISFKATEGDGGIGFFGKAAVTQINLSASDNEVYSGDINFSSRGELFQIETTDSTSL